MFVLSVLELWDDARGILVASARSGDRSMTALGAEKRGEEEVEEEEEGEDEEEERKEEQE